MTRSPHARAEDDKMNLADIREARGALEAAEEGLRKAMEGQGQDERERFIFHVGFARGRLARVSERIYRGCDDAP
jgi:hypothetical protein